MNDATTYYFRTGDAACTKSAAEAAPAVGQLLPMDAKAKGRRRDQERQEQACSPGYAADGFLKCQFLPKLLPPQSSKDCGDTAHAEQSFYDSLSLAVAHYNIVPIHTRDYGYPYNLTLALWDARRKIKSNVDHWDGLQLIRAGERVSILATERLNMGMYLYYIPVIPLYRMLHDFRRKEAALLLLSVCSYLYRIADVPYYRTESCHLYWYYEMLSDWVSEEDDDEKECRTQQLRELKGARQIGDHMGRLIKGEKNLNLLRERVIRFKACDELDRECLKVAEDAISLYTLYPNENIFRNGSREEEQEDYDQYDGEILSMDKYISFVADRTGPLYETLFSMINTDFNGCPYKEEPCIQKHFNGKPITGDLVFEVRLVALIERLCSVLEND